MNWCNMYYHINGLHLFSDTLYLSETVKVSKKFYKVWHIVKNKYNAVAIFPFSVNIVMAGLPGDRQRGVTHKQTRGGC